MPGGKRQKHPRTPSDSDEDFDPAASPLARRGGGDKRSRGGDPGQITSRGLGLGCGKGKGKALSPRSPSPSVDEESEEGLKEEEEEAQSQTSEEGNEYSDDSEDEVVHQPGPMHSSVTYQMLAPQMSEEFRIPVALSRDEMREYRHTNPWT
ncbi:hypothetical protein PR202_ga31301 [Eleusine coracana subsp. coracana]|uniref:Uncharacterized protein n=1 Tax=Eleusine coracana subsp. coracana TaxID=191504 RepID=A0AAV5DS98_ELECO|nr:hypothetical protein PR202_ga31301 [Eleusine coracana subsp. coracana]